MQEYFIPKTQPEIDERIDVQDTPVRTEEERPLQSPDILRYVALNQLLRARNSPGGNGFSEDWMFKEQVEAQQKQQQQEQQKEEPPH